MNADHGENNNQIPLGMLPLWLLVIEMHEFCLRSVVIVPVIKIGITCFRSLPATLRYRVIQTGWADFWRVRRVRKPCHVRYGLHLSGSISSLIQILALLIFHYAWCIYTEFPQLQLVQRTSLKTRDPSVRVKGFMIDKLSDRVALNFRIELPFQKVCPRIAFTGN